ncbi:putative reverse transcriptase domain-containing protein [Tanacetum coccineum]
MAAPILVAPEVGAAKVSSPAGVLELDTHSSSEVDPSESSPPPVSIALMVFPFLCSEDSESDTKIPERHVSPTTCILEIPTTLILPAPSTVEDIPIGRLYCTHPGRPCRVLIVRKSVRPLPFHRLALRYTSHHLDYFTSGSSSSHSSSDHSSSGYSILGHSLSEHTPPDTTDADSSTPPRFFHPLLARTPRCSEVYLRWSSAPLSTMYPPMTSESSVGDSSSDSSTGPSRKRCRFPAATMTSSIRAMRALVPSHADLFLPRKRFKDSNSPEDSVEEDIDTDVLEDIETGQRGLESRSLIVGGERANLLEQVASLERSNVRLRGTMMMERAKADRFQRRVRFIESELRFSSMMLCMDLGLIVEPVTMTITRSGMTPEAIKELINQRVEEALAAYEATHAVNALEAESQSQNGSDSDNGNGGNGNGGDGNGGNGNPNENNKDARHIETVFHISNCPEKYQVKYATCTLLNSALTWWNSHKRTIGTEAAFAMSWRELMKLMAEVYCPRNEIQKMESELWNLTVKNNDLAAYTQRFQELTMMCTKMVPEEEDRVEKFIEGLPDNIQGNVIAAEPTKLQDVVRIANNLMDQKLKGYAVKNDKNKRRAYTAGNTKRKPYNGSFPLYNKCKLHHEGPCTVRCGKCNKVRHLTRDCKVTNSTTSTQRGQVVNQRVLTCFECGRQGHYMSDFPKLKYQNRGNKNGVGKARGKAYVLGGGESNLDLNVVKGTFLLNNHYASMIFDTGADRSFVSTTFSTLLDITLDTLDVSYAVELADGRISKTNTVLEVVH